MIEKIKKFYKDHEVQFYLLGGTACIALSGGLLGYGIGHKIGYHEGTQDGVTGAYALWYYALEKGIDIKAEDLTDVNFVSNLMEKIMEEQQ